MSDCEDHELALTWRNENCHATLSADLREHGFRISHRDETGAEERLTFD
jgi:hypothetical protein